MGDITVRDVARRAGVSQGTVSNFFHSPHKLGADASARVAAAIDELGYVRNNAARMLRVGESTTIGHLTLEVGNPFFSSVADSVELAAEEAGFSVFLANSGGSVAREERYLELFKQQRVRGLVLSLAGPADEPLRRLRDRGIPTVLVDQVGSDALGASVVVDDLLGGELAVRHLVEAGSRRIAFVGGSLEINTIRLRLQGAEKAVKGTAASLEVIEHDERSISAGRRIGEALALRPTEERPDGVFAVNDLLAIGILHGLVQHGVNVPADVAVIGYDDIEFAGESVVPLSTIRRPAELFGRTAVQLLLHDILGEEGDRERQVVFKPVLVARASTGGRV